MIFGRIWRYVASVLAALLPVVYILGRKDAKQKVKADAAIQNEKAQERGRKAVADGRSSGDGPSERLRKNDGRWM